MTEELDHVLTMTDDGRPMIISFVRRYIDWFSTTTNFHCPVCDTDLMMIRQKGEVFPYIGSAPYDPGSLYNVDVANMRCGVSLETCPSCSARIPNECLWVPMAVISASREQWQGLLRAINYGFFRLAHGQDEKIRTEIMQAIEKFVD